MANGDSFLSGVIEGFYGQPWSQAERFQLFDWLRDWGLNTYFYAPKDDLKHRALWRELYSDAEALELQMLIAGCQARGLRFIYGIAPGLDIKYSDDWEITVLKVKLEQLQKLGCRDFAILFDDIADRLNGGDVERFGSFAKAQCHVANTVMGLLPKADRFLFCPTAYCGRMAAAKLGGEDYLATVGRGLSLKIDVFWTGLDIISREIAVEHVREVAGLLRRKPVIWDNLHANDYDGRRFFVGPYAGRPPELKPETAGILSNPNCEFALNYVPIRTLGWYMRGFVESARAAYLDAMEGWLPYVTANGFFTTFVNVGGTGATIALALVMLNSRDPGYRKISRLSLPTQIFQINEPIFFGFPIVLNPVFMIPYILNALILTASSYLLMAAGVIQKPFVNVPWTTPPIIGHYLVTGGDWKAAVWGGLSILIAMAVYYPFAKAAERQRLKGSAQ